MIFFYHLSILPKITMQKLHIEAEKCERIYMSALNLNLGKYNIRYAI